MIGETMEDINNLSVSYWDCTNWFGKWHDDTAHFLIWFDDGILVIEVWSTAIYCWFIKYNKKAIYFTCHEAAYQYCQDHYNMRSSSLLELLIRTGITSQWVEQKVVEKRTEEGQKGCAVVNGRR